MRCIPSVLICGALLVPGLTGAQVLEVQGVDIRPVGYTLGDHVPRQVEILVEPGWTLRAASLPAEGPQSYWLELRDLQVSERDTERGRRYLLDLTYQTFYAPIQALERSLPGFVLEFVSVDNVTTASVPPWTFTMSPLREVRLSTGETGDSGIRPRPDQSVAPPQLSGTWAVFWSGLAGVAVLLLLLAWHHAWPPFHARPHRPFARAARALRRSPADAVDYRARLQRLHRAFDEAAGYRLLSDDIAGLIRLHPGLAGLRGEIERFFHASQLAFFGGDDASAQALLPPAELTALGARLAAAERAA